MNRDARVAFLALILAQAAHSIEEYITRLYDVLPPARFVSGLLAEDRRIGFALVNFSIVAFGLWCSLRPIRDGSRLGTALAWFRVVLELSNGSAHLAWAASARDYRPGLATAPILLARPASRRAAATCAHVALREAFHLRFSG